MKTHSKRWLMSRMKTSGSKRRYVSKFRYVDEPHTWKAEEAETMPFRQSVETSHKFYNGKVNYDLLVRFLRGRIGQDWDEVYAAILSRIPTKLLHHKEMIFWFVADDVAITPEGLWNRKSHKFI